MQVSLAPRRTPAVAAPRLLDRRGAAVVLGSVAALPAPLQPAADTLFGPRGACLVGPEGPLVVCDTGHHRVLVWSRRPVEDGAPADLVIGQPDLAHEGRNANGAVGAATVNVPTGVAATRDGLAIADAWNHRVLLWHAMPTRANQPADVVLGQADFASAAPNRGRDAPDAGCLNWCAGVALQDGRLFVADTGNRRVLVWDRLPARNGAPADRVLGQADFAARDESAGGRDDALGMRWPHAIALAGDRVLVADAGKNRVMIWDRLPERPGVPCDAVLGQGDRNGADANAGGAAPTPVSLNQPYGLAQLGDRLVAADTANSRLLGYALADLRTGIAADRLAGQPDFSRRDERGGRAAGRDGLCWPFGVSACGDTLVVADTGNNRVLLWGTA